MLQVLLWVLLWFTLLGLAGLVFFVLGRSLWRKSVLLLRELGTASEQLSQVSAQLQELAERSQQPAVFDSPSALRADRYLSKRARGGR